jgi:hypothetical protein
MKHRPTGNDVIPNRAEGSVRKLLARDATPYSIGSTIADPSRALSLRAGRCTITIAASTNTIPSV